MAYEEHRNLVPLRRHFPQDGVSDHWLHEAVGEAEWEDGTKAVITSALGSNVIVRFEGDDPGESYVVDAEDVAEAAKALRDRIRQRQPVNPVTVEQAVSEIAAGTFLGGFEETRREEPLPPDVASKLNGEG